VQINFFIGKILGLSISIISNKLNILGFIFYSK
jgi:hypothetical protein